MDENTVEEEKELVAPAEPNDAEDVDACLKRETQDGSGLENNDETKLPEPDFESFAEEDVEEETA